MQNTILKKKGFATISIFIIVLISFSTAAQSLIIKEQTTSLKTTLNNQYNGTLSGYVRDSSNNSIEGALVQVYFHEEYRENYSDSNGYYHVTDIPICYCLKNATCSKEGYKTEWVFLSISENTTYDFTLYSLDPCYPVFNGTMGCNGWYVSPVEVSFVYNPEIVAEIWYHYKQWHNYTEPFLIDDEGIILVEYYWIDYEGVQSIPHRFYLRIDQSLPIVDIQWEIYKVGLKWYVNFLLTAEDPISGMAPNLLIYLNDVLQAEFYVLSWPSEFECQWSKSFKYFTFGFMCFDNAGNMVYKSINGSDIKSYKIYQHLYTQRFYNIFFQHFLGYFIKSFF